MLRLLLLQLWLLRRQPLLQPRLLEMHLAFAVPSGQGLQKARARQRRPQCMT
jgi:hypothetical protein